MFLYQPIHWYSWLAWAGILLALILLNEVTRRSKWTGLAFFVVLPVALNIFVWPHTSGAGSGAQTANWFNWTKVWSALVGCYIGLSLRFTKLGGRKWALVLAPAILAINIMEAVIREFQVIGMQGVIDGMFYMGGPWNLMNGVAGILNMLTICGWSGIVFSKSRSRDLLWPDMTWFWIIAYDLWNYTYTYNCLTDRSFFSAALLISCTIPAFTIKKGAWAQHRVQTLALYMMAMMTVPNFFIGSKFAVASTHSPAAFYALSALSLAANLGVAVYQVYVIAKRRKHPLKDELYDHFKSSQAVLESAY